MTLRVLDRKISNSTSVWEMPLGINNTKSTKINIRLKLKNFCFTQRSKFSVLALVCLKKSGCFSTVLCTRVSCLLMVPVYYSVNI